MDHDRLTSIERRLDRLEERLDDIAGWASQRHGYHARVALASELQQEALLAGPILAEPSAEAGAPGPSAIISPPAAAQPGLEPTPLHVPTGSEQPRPAMP